MCWFHRWSTNTWENIHAYFWMNYSLGFLSERHLVHTAAADDDDDDVVWTWSHTSSLLIRPATMFLHRGGGSDLPDLTKTWPQRARMTSDPERKPFITRCCSARTSSCLMLWFWVWCTFLLDSLVSVPVFMSSNKRSKSFSWAQNTLLSLRSCDRRTLGFSQ